MVVLESAMRPLLRRDFIALLPEEIALAILAYLPPTTLLRCAQVCRAWRHAASHDVLWRPHCDREQLARDVVPAMRQRFGPRHLSWKEARIRRGVLEGAGLWAVVLIILLP